MAFSNNQTLAAADLNNLADLTSAQAFSGVQTFSGANNPAVSTSQRFVEQSSAPTTPATSSASIYVDNANPPLLKLVQDDGDVHIVGGHQYDETRRDWVLFDRDTTTITYHRPQQVELADSFFKVRADTTNDVLHTVQGNWKILATGTDAYPAVTGRNHTRIQTGAVGNDRVALLTAVSTSDYGALRRDNQVVFIAIVDAVETTSKVIQFGMALDPSATLNPGADGIYWEYDSAASANWIGVVRTGAANTDLDSTVAAAAGAREFAFIVTGGTNVRFLSRAASTSAWTDHGTNSGTQPGASTDLIPFFKVETLTTAAKNLDLYHVYITGYQSI